MIKLIFTILLFPVVLLSQNDFTGKRFNVIIENGKQIRQTVITPERNTNGRKTVSEQNISQPISPFNNTSVKWSYFDPVSIGDFCETNSNGSYAAVSWNLNNPRISFYGNANATPLWEFTTDPNGFLNFISMSDTGGVIASGSYHNFYLFNSSGGSPFFNYDITVNANSGTASSIDVTADGKFLISCDSRSDTSTVFGFNSQSAVPFWSKRIIPATENGAAIQGVKMSGNDSLVIVNTYSEYFIFRTYTGELIFSGTNANGTQSAQGISGDGKVIAIIDYRGFIRVYRWAGSAYTLQFTNQEPPGTYFNWYTAVEISYDGEYIAAGTLNFITLSEYDGKVKVFKTGNGATPLWTFSGCGDEVSKVSFSKSANILSASSWGSIGNIQEDLFIWKTNSGNVPIFKLNTTGSLFWCSTSANGTAVVASGKAVHAREFGSGGELYFIDVDTTDVPSGVNPLNAGTVSDFRLYQNYPNPFNPSTVIHYELAKNGFTELKIFDVLGNEIQTLVNQLQIAGSYETEFNGADLPSGIYFYKLISNGSSVTKRMMLLK